MYLADKHIKDKLIAMDIYCDNPEYPFITEEQIQPCSIDFRLSNIFWEPMKIKSIDLRKSRLLEISPRHYWRKKILRKGECITLKPGKLLLGRTYEKFTIPDDCAGKIEGRSSFSRMGLNIHCTADFVNPGYRGHMPLQLINFSRNPIKVFPYLPICQLILIKLTDTPDEKYGSKSLQSKYMDEDGGPSYWWRDKRIKSLQETFRKTDISIDIQERTLDKIGAQEPEILERFEKYVEKINISSIENADMLLDSFLKNEKKNYKFAEIRRGFYKILLPIFSGPFIGVLYGIKKTCAIHYILGICTFISLVLCIYAFQEQHKQYLDEGQLSKK